VDNSPNCSIIVLNYFGEKVIQETVLSLEKLNYPKSKYEIIIVDNNSQDRSKELIQQLQKKYKNIKSVFQDKNLGFSKGNNIGISYAKGQYVVLLNNDCIVDKNWLKELVKVAQKDPKIFAVNSKIILYPKYFKIEFKVDKDLILTGVHLIESDLCKVTGGNDMPLLTLNENDRIINNKSILECLFVPNQDQVIKIRFSFETSKKLDQLKVKAVELCNLDKRGYQIKSFQKDNKGINCDITIDLNQAKVKSYEKVQNAGIMVFQDGAGRDIGASVSYSKQNYERDYNQFSKEKEVYGACGAAVLLNKKILNRIGYLDESFFMYYEDVEISERARLRGYKILFCPKAVVRHMHAFSSVEWSNFFVYHTEKGRLLHTFFHFPFRVFVKEYIYMISRAIGVMVKMITLININRSKEYIDIICFFFKKSRSEKKQRKDLGKTVQYFKIIIFFLTHFFLLYLHRRIKHTGIPNKSIEDNYNEILSGRWYFN
jgi:GT2 family glycosyltransferase